MALALPDPLHAFVEHYRELRNPAWTEASIDDPDRANKRVLALAREAGWGSGWDEQIQSYLRLHRLALANARHNPLLATPRTGLWTISRPQVVQRLSGSYAISVEEAEGWDCVYWTAFPVEVAIDLHCIAREQGVTVPTLIRRAVIACFDHR